jgi:hypothetical protein
MMDFYKSTVIYLSFINFFKKEANHFDFTMFFRVKKDTVIQVSELLLTQSYHKP